MRLRSLLFVPGDRPDRMRKALASGADVLILDLEDSVALEAKAAARDHVHNFVESGEAQVPLLVRINQLQSLALADDLSMLNGLSVAGIVLPKSEGQQSVLELASMLPQAFPILPIATETPAAIFGLGSYGVVSDRLCGLTWGAEDLPAAIGAYASRLPGGAYTPPYELARSLTLFAAHAAGVQAIDTVFPDFSNLDALDNYARAARRDGFTGMLAIHPAQVPVINRAMQPDPSEIARAERIVAAFAEQNSAGAIQLDGRMLDRPHLLLARRLLGL